MIYKFKIWFEDNEEIIRGIEMKSNSSFEQFHYAIQDAIEFDGQQIASFHVCNDHWFKGMEITQFDMMDDPLLEEEINPEDIKPLMSQTKLSDFVIEPKQKFIYTYDFIQMWTLKIQLLAIEEEIKGILYPRLYDSIGDAPNQQKGTSRFKIIDSIEMDEIAKEIKKSYSNETEYDDNDIDPDIMGEFEEFY